jgi:hypothetical protein
VYIQELIHRLELNALSAMNEFLTQCQTSSKSNFTPPLNISLQKGHIIFSLNLGLQG